MSSLTLQKLRELDLDALVKLATNIRSMFGIQPIRLLLSYTAEYWISDYSSAKYRMLNPFIAQGTIWLHTAIPSELQMNFFGDILVLYGLCIDKYVWSYLVWSFYKNAYTAWRVILRQIAGTMAIAIEKLDVGIFFSSFSAFSTSCFSNFAIMEAKLLSWYWNARLVYKQNKRGNGHPLRPLATSLPFSLTWCGRYTWACSHLAEIFPNSYRFVNSAPAGHFSRTAESGFSFDVSFFQQDNDLVDAGSHRHKVRHNAGFHRLGVQIGVLLLSSWFLWNN